MADIAGGVDPSVLDRLATIEAKGAAFDALVPTIPTVLPGNYTVDTLPGPQANVGKYARVTDLFGQKIDLVLASKAGAAFFWQPVRPAFAANQAVTADTTLQALKHPSILYFTGTLPGVGLFRSVTLSPVLAFPGASFRIKNAMTGLGTLRIGNVNLGTPLSIVLGGTQEFIYDMVDGWKQIT